MKMCVYIISISSPATGREVVAGYTQTSLLLHSSGKVNKNSGNDYRITNCNGEYRVIQLENPKDPQGSVLGNHAFEPLQHHKTEP